MKLKLKENPREWQKFTIGVTVMLCVASLFLQRGGLLPGHWLVPPVLGAAVILLCLLRPAWFRGFYRAGMRASFTVGQFMGGFLLTVFFLLILTPMGLFLRLIGKDLLALKRDPSATTYWRTAKSPSDFDRQF